jgi:hypothetical protein
LTDTTYPATKFIGGLRALSTRTIGLEARLWLWVAGAMLTVIALIAVAVLLLCNGHLVYSFDDPYISLSLGWHIGHGHYGINDSEVSSPSSSILYPFVLAAFAWTTWQTWVPLLLNALAASATAALFAVILCRTGAVTRRDQLAPASILVVSLCLAINLAGLVFTGLEHSLHALTSVVVVYGLARTLEGKETPPWLVAAIVLAPLWRFEGMALSSLAICALVLAGRWRAACVALAGIAVTVGAYMIAMHAMGLTLLPSSVMVKSYMFKPGAIGGSPLGFLQSTWDNFSARKPAHYLMLLIALVVLHPLLRALRVRGMSGPYRFTLRREWIFAAVVAGAMAAHMLLGERGWFFRYEIYAVALGAAGAVIIWHRAIRALLMLEKPLVILVACLALFEIDQNYAAATFYTPLGSRNIYEQQYQMHRFVLDYYRAPVAVNDLGLSSYRNPNYVLDLWGLGSEPARQARLTTHEADWMDRLVQVHHVGLAMIYEEWFEHDIPANWQKLAVLDTSHSAVTAGEDQVAFYATSPQAAPAALAALRDFAAVSGPNTQITILADAPAAH